LLAAGGCAMKTRVFLLVALGFVGLISAGAAAQSDVPNRASSHPTVSQLRQDATHPTQAEFQVAKAETAKAAGTSSVAPAESALTERLRHDADELAYLAQSIPPDVDKTAKGLLPKDLALKLKRIEELSKQLRTRIAQ
jgi:cytoskeletal protein RodZ